MQEPRFIAWGGYDRGKPRVRLLLEAFHRKRLLFSEININIWNGIEDKSVAGRLKIVRSLLRLLAGYPSALARLITTPRHCYILLLYPAIFDIFVIYPLARLRGQKIVFDAFISLYDTIVSDRKLVKPSSLLARWLWCIERAALSRANVILVDTDQHGCYFSETFNISSSKFITAPVGAEALFWDARSRPVVGLTIPTPYVLFYGQLIPLHGIETILRAVEATKDKEIHWLIIGSGQEEGVLKEFYERFALTNMIWMPWVEYENLPNYIRGATISLGIFGKSAKAARVIPNKMFQVLAAGGAIITRESPAVAELASECPRSIRLVLPDDPAALAEAVIETVDEKKSLPVPMAMREKLSPDSALDQLVQALGEMRRSK